MKKDKLKIYPSFKGSGIKVIGSSEVSIESLPRPVEEMLTVWQAHYDMMVEDCNSEIKCDRLMQLGRRIAFELKNYIPEFKIEAATLKEIKLQMASDIKSIALQKESTGNDSEAVTLLRRRLSLDRTNKEYMFDLAVSVYNTQNFKEALLLFQEIQQLDPLSPEIKFSIALCYFYLDENDSAQIIFNELLISYPNEKSFIMVASSNFIAVREYSSAIELLQKGLKIFQQDYDMLKELSNVYHLQGDFECEFKTLQKLIKIFPQDIDVRRLICECLISCELYHEAIKNFKEILHVHPEEGGIYFEIAKLYHKLNMDQFSSEMYLKAILRNPDFTKYFWGAEKLLLKLNIDEALRKELLLFGNSYGDASAKKHLEGCAS